MKLIDLNPDELKHLKIFSSRANDLERALYTVEIHNISVFWIAVVFKENILIESVILWIYYQIASKYSISTKTPVARIIYPSPQVRGI